jgi:DNA-binding MarR family transcriptional regulator
MTILFPPPEIRSRPSGEPVAFDLICLKAEMRLVVSTSTPPDVRVHRESVDFKAVAPGRIAYCLGLPLLTGDPRQKSRLIIAKLAYQFHDWAAREVMAADRRELIRQVPETAERLRKALSPVPLKVLLHLCENGQARVGDLAGDLILAQPHVSRAVQTLLDARMVECRRTGRYITVFPSILGRKQFSDLAEPERRGLQPKMR